MICVCTGVSVMHFLYFKFMILYLAVGELKTAKGNLVMKCFGFSSNE